MAFKKLALVAVTLFLATPAHADGLTDILSVLDQGSRTLNAITYGSGCGYKKGVQRVNCQVQDAQYKIKRAEQLHHAVYGGTSSRIDSYRRAPSDRILTKADANDYYWCSKGDRAACSQIALTPTRAQWALEDSAIRLGVTSPEAVVQKILNN